MGVGAVGMIGSALGAPDARAAARIDDRQALLKVLAAERLMVWVYERVLDAGALGGPARRTAELILGHEHEHVRVLASALGGTPAAPPITLASAEAQLAAHHVGASPRHLETQHDCIRLLVDIESLAEGAWFTAIGKLSSPVLATTAAGIMASEAQHWTVLSALSHRGDPKITVPYPFVRGSTGF